VLLAAPSAYAASDQQDAVNHALGTLQDLRHDKAFGNATSLMKRARAVMIAPRIFKAGFFVGGEGGTGLLMARGPQGWSDPAFYLIGSASFGLQIGAKESELVLFIMNDKALQAFMRDRFKIGANAGVTVATLGSSAEAATTANLNADVIAWASSSGAYAGISLEGTVFQPRDSYNRDYYGRAVKPMDIVIRRDVHNNAAGPLVSELAALGG
jgi:lipid-binding SYLF domain-containing protein